MADQIKITTKIYQARLQLVVRRETKKWVHDLMRQIRNSAIIRAPVDTGLLRSSHDIKVSSGIFKTKGELINRARYAEWVHDGRRGFGPKTKKALRFKIKGVVVFRTRVGPQKAQPWLRDAMIAVARKHKLRVVKR